MSLVRFRPTTITPDLRARLQRQNPGRVRASTSNIRTKVAGEYQEFLFGILEGRTDRDGLPGIPYRVSACVPNPRLPLFPTPVGLFDYRITRNDLTGITAISGMNHDLSSSPSGNRFAMKVEKETRKKFRGIGRTMAGIALNHIASKGAEYIYIHNIANLRFYYELSRTTEVFEFYDDNGPISGVPTEADARDPNTVISVKIRVTCEDKGYIPRIILSLRSEPVEQVFRNLFTQPQET